MGGTVPAGAAAVAFGFGVVLKGDDSMPGHKEEIRPCLIGGFACKNAHSVPLAHYMPTAVEGSGGVLSVDMVRLKLSAKTPAAGEKLADALALLPSTEDNGFRSYVSNLVPGRYRVLSTCVMGDSSVTLGAGLVGKNSKVDWQQAFCEFNPNKVCTTAARDTFGRWLGRVAAMVKRAELARWDLAYDVPIERVGLRVEKDKRRYEFVQDKTLTEYLGARNAPGRVKVYDKAGEQGLEGVALTRVELTCSGDWGVNEIAERWPVVYGVRVQPELGLSNANALLVGLLAERVRRGLSVEPELTSLNRRTRVKVRAALEDVGVLPFPRAEVAEVRATAVKWTGLVLPDVAL